jgi:restriction system protein
MIEFPLPTLSPQGFELFVKRLLDAESDGLLNYRSNHRESIVGSDGTYEFDVTFRFSSVGVDYLTLVECKCHKNPVKREVVQALWAKLQSVGAQKGLIFATIGFQSGAIEFAKSHGIALVTVADGRTSYSVRHSDAEPIPWELVPDNIPKVVGWVIDGDLMSRIEDTDGRSP